MHLVEEKGWEILNWNKNRNDEDELTYVGPKGESVIDYSVVDVNTWEELRRKVEISVRRSEGNNNDWGMLGLKKRNKEDIKTKENPKDSKRRVPES